MTEMTNMAIVKHCEEIMRGQRDTLPDGSVPKTLGDVWRIMRKALDDMPEAERAALARQDDAVGRYIASAKHSSPHINPRVG